MSSKEKEIIPIFFDSSVVYSHNPNGDLFDKKIIIDEIIKIRDFFKTNFLRDDLLLIIPKIVECERKIQKIEALSKLLDKLDSNRGNLERISGEDILISPSTETILTNFKVKLDEEINNFFSKNTIKSASIASLDHFNTIVDLALHKKVPFDSKGVGFKDALIWFSIHDYLKGVNDELLFLAESDASTPICKRAYFFNDNTKDFLSSDLKKELKSRTGVDLFLVLPPNSDNNTFELKYSDFLKEIIGDTNNLNIVSITVFFEENDEKLYIYQIHADPFPSDISPFVSKKEYIKINYEDILKRNLFSALESLNFKYNADAIKITYKKTPAIFEIRVDLDFHKSGMYYKIASVEVEYWDGREQSIELKPIILFDGVYFSLDQWGDEVIEISHPYKISIIEMIEEALNRKIKPESITFTNI